MNYSLPERIRRYFYSDGRRQIPLFSIDAADRMELLAEGWYWVEGVMLYPRPHPLPDFEGTITHGRKINEMMLIKRGN